MISHFLVEHVFLVTVYTLEREREREREGERDIQNGNIIGILDKFYGPTIDAY